MNLRRLTNGEAREVAELLDAARGLEVIEVGAALINALGRVDRLEREVAELRAASGARPVVEPYDSPRRTSFVGRVREATGCSEDEADRIVADMERTGFAGDAGQFREMAHALLLRHRAMEADPSPLASTPDKA